MPMDIRDFFKKKGTTTTGKKPSTAKKSAAVPSTASGKRSTGTTTTTAAAAAGKSSSSSNIRKTSKRSQAKNAGSENEKNQILMDEDLEPTKTSPAKKGEGPKLSPGKRRRIRVESDDEDYVEIISQPISPRKSSSPLRQKKATGHKIEVSASDYFAGASKASAVTQTTARTGAVKSPGPSPSKKMKPISSPPQEKSSSSDKTPSPVKSKSPAKRPSPAPKETSPPKASPAKKARASPRKEEKSLAPLDTKPLPSFSASQAAIECLQGYTFCITAVDPDWSREDATDFLKTMGARVTTAVSGKTDYLVVLGETLEDQRHYTEGSKYKQATERGTRVIVGKSLLNGVVKYHSDQKGGPPTLKDPPAPAPAASAAAKNPYDRKPSSNPYARKPSNPYERKPSNPYARKPATANPAAAPSPPPPVPRAVQSGPMLWVDKYKPASSRDILGNQEAVRKLRVWLDIWESNFNKDSVVGKAFSNPKGPWKAVLLSGPPGIGST
jgi:replication factor C subunit 1